MEQLKLLDTVTPMRHPDRSNQPNYLGFPLTCDNFNYCKNSSWILVASYRFSKLLRCIFKAIRGKQRICGKLCGIYH